MEQQITFEKRNEILSSHLTKLRERYKDKVGELSKKIFDIQNVPMLQVELYTERQLVLEELSYMQEKVSSYNTKIRTMKGQLLENKYKSNYDLRLTSTETIILIERDIAQDLQIKEILSVTVEFLNETLKTFDSLIYGISNRIRVEEYRNI